jgi:hypothetical protein
MQMAIVTTKSWLKSVKEAADRFERAFCTLGDQLF